jgi:hypothetical protein
MKAIVALIRIWAQNKTENRLAWLQALNRVVCAGERSTGSILFLAFPQELIFMKASFVSTSNAVLSWLIR